MIYNNTNPRYLPHIEHPHVLQMGLSPMQKDAWIETDDDLPLYVQHKRNARKLYRDRVYRAECASVPAQLELREKLRAHLLHSADNVYFVRDNTLCCSLADCSGSEDDSETLWSTSLWVADDLVLMEERNGEYCLTAASLCSPSHWLLEEKFGRPMREIHDPVPGFNREISSSIDRFFAHLKPSHPVVRFNWSLQAEYRLAQFPSCEPEISRETELYYRCERQSVVRLPATGAIAFTIRVYLHPLAQLTRTTGAMSALFSAIDNTPATVARYKDFDSLAIPLAKYKNLQNTLS
jgi:hypothetical protein